MLAECPGDLDGSGTVEVADVLGLLSVFGCAQDCGESDLDGDDAVGASDILLVLIARSKLRRQCSSVWADSTFEVLFEDNVVYGAGMSHDGWGGPVIDTIALELDVYAPDNQEEGGLRWSSSMAVGFLEAATSKGRLWNCPINTPPEVGSFFPSTTVWLPKEAQSRRRG